MLRKTRFFKGMDGTDLTVITGAVQCQCCHVVFTYVQCSAVQSAVHGR